MRIIFIFISLLWVLAGHALAASPIAINPAAGSHAPGTVSINTDGITYFAQAGDTLSSIAQKLTTHAGNWVTLGQLNRISKDISIPIGAGIVIPANLLPDEPNQGTISAFSGQVKASAADGREVRVTLGAVVREGARIETGSNSFLTLTLADKSRVSIPSNSHIKLTQLRMARYTKSPRTEVTLLQGRVESYVAPLDSNKGRFEVRTPFSVTGVRGTHFRVAANATQSRNEVLTGSVAVGTSTAPAVPMLNGGQGNIVNAQGVGRAVDLLPPPQLKSAPALDGLALRFELRSLPGASGYQIQIATDVDAQHAIAESRSNSPQVSFDRLPDGVYFAQLSAVDPSGLEGMPRTVKFTLPPEPQTTAGAPAPRRASITPGVSTELNWAANAEAQAYRLRIARDPAFRVIADEVELSGTRYQSTPLQPGQYYWQIAAVSTRNGVRVQEPFGATQTVTVRPRQGPPYVEDSDSDKLSLRWPGQRGQKFLLQIARDPGFTWLLSSSTTNGPEIHVTRPVFGTYYARVQPINTDGSVTPFSRAQAFVVTDHWIIHDGQPFSVQSGPLQNSGRNSD